MKMIMQVHDELVFEVNETDLAVSEEKIRNIMEQCVTLKVPLKVDVGCGINWDEAH